MKNILVIGSTNTDMVVKTVRFPKPGETLTGGEFFLFPGGKGANQAVAAARLGGEVTFITRLGNDLFGQQAREGLTRENIDTSFIYMDNSSASGVALITVNESGENTIVVAPGANARLNPEDLDHLLAVFSSAEIILLQLEIPMPAVEHAVNLAFSLGKRIILNPAPAQALKPEILNKLFAITPNETEAELLTGIPVTDNESADQAAGRMIEMGVENVIITMGSRGAWYRNKEHKFLAPAPSVEAIDTTAAGDVFNGAMAVALVKDLDWHQAIRFANRAAAISVTRLGAQSSAPTAGELLLF
jgi:ribokinase